MTKPAYHPDTVPPADEIAVHLQVVHNLTPHTAHAWTEKLHGLPWRYVRPIAAAAHAARHLSPIATMLYAAKYSEDQAFKTAIDEHIKGWGT